MQTPIWQKELNELAMRHVYFSAEQFEGCGAQVFYGKKFGKRWSRVKIV